MATQGIKIPIEVTTDNLSQVTAKIVKTFSSLGRNIKSSLSSVSSRGSMTRDLKELQDNINKGNVPVKDLQSNFDILNNKLNESKLRILEMKTQLSATKDTISNIKTVDSKNAALEGMLANYNKQKQLLTSLNQKYTIYSNELKIAKTQITQLAKAEKEAINQQEKLRREQLKAEKERLKEEEKLRKEQIRIAEEERNKSIEATTNLYRLNAAMTASKQIMSSLYGILVDTSTAYAQNKISTNAYKIILDSVSSSANEFKNNLNSIVDTLADFGYNKSNIQQMAVDFYTLANATGMAQSKALTLTSDYLKMANRISLATGQTLEETTALLKQALATGEAQTLMQRTGIDLRNESVKKLAVEKGLISSVNDELSQEEMFYLRQYALTNGIVNNQNLMNNQGSQYLIKVSQVSAQITSLKENIGALLEGPVTTGLSLLNSVLKGVNDTINALNTANPILKTLTSGALALGIALTVIYTGTILIKVGMQKISTLLDQLGLKTSVWGTKTFTVIKMLGMGLSLLTSIAMMYSGISGLLSKSSEKVTDSVSDSTDAIEEENKSAQKLKNTLMSFDEINLLNTDTTTGGLNEELFKKLYGEESELFNTDSIEKMNEGLAETERRMNIINAVIGTATTLWGLYTIAIKLANIAKAKQLAMQYQMPPALAKEAVARAVNEKATVKETIAIKASNIAKIAGKAISNPLFIATALATVGATIAAFSSQQDSATKSANGNYFPTASTTLIGEKYPEVAIPLGQSPQFAKMQDTIANATAEKLSQMNGNNGFNGTVNVYVGNEQLREIAVKAVEDELRTSYGTNLGKLAQGR